MRGMAPPSLPSGSSNSSSRLSFGGSNTNAAINSLIGKNVFATTGPQRETVEVPEWMVHEDWAILQTVQAMLELPLSLTVIAPGHTPNWDFIADVVNSMSRTYRSPKQCKHRYENIVVPREEGKAVVDPYVKKQKKQKTSLYKVQF